MNGDRHWLEAFITDFKSALVITKILKKEKVTVVVVTPEIWRSIYNDAAYAKLWGDNRVKTRMRWGGRTRCLTINSVRIGVYQYTQVLSAPEN